MNPLLMKILMPLVWVVLLWLLPAVVAMRIFREKGYSWGWLAAGVVPFSGLPLLCLALLLPDMRPDAEANPRPLLKLSNLAGFGLVVTNVLSGLVAVAWLLLSSLAGPGPLPGLQDPRVTAELQQQVANLPLFRTQTAELGVPEVVAVSELMSPPSLQRRVGRATLRHRQGEEHVTFTLRWNDQRPATFAVLLDPLPLPPVTAPRVAPAIRRAIAATPGFQARSLRDEQWTLENVTELSSTADGMQRVGVATWKHPAGEEPVRFVVTSRLFAEGQLEVRIEELTLPTANSREVEQTLRTVLQANPLFRGEQGAPARLDLVLIEELAFDSEQQRRKGMATVKTQGTLKQVPFTVAWRDRSRGQYHVSLDEPDLPPVDAPEVAVTLKHVLEASPTWQAYREQLGQVEILKATEVGYDEARQERTGRALIRHRIATQEVEFVVKWLDRAQGMFGVAMVPMKRQLPMVESSDVAERLQGHLSELIAQHGGGKVDPVVEISRLIELSYDETQQRRFGRARVRPGQEADEVEIEFMVFWSDRAQSCWGLQMKSPEIPRFDLHTVRHEIKHAISDSTRFNSRLQKIGKLEVDSTTEVVFDTTEQKRVGRAKVKHALGTEEVKFAIRWNDQARGIWEVQVLDD